ncbi:50S ribosomal protein L32e [Pyrobaculum neutrophilum]|uniref:Large ribosomal subunit protein eL32 n=1 Tax=Pyrobaculum neutrophilum (strain DSM 2338 / JCM 9278 / NBRC 100436 / V24Sta) TaxID=444157 RepID=B1Y8V4_PYRNV|nr:50S ribosomal protein L32e [Pyrobaculum neutrophilum]ACB40183.1 Ribosomal protein L32e [Pyrobaculum neutrophilum V24Sta]
MSARPRRDLPQPLRRLLKLRLVLKRRKPEFVRIDQWRYKRIEDSGWRNQRTIDNKIRRKWKGWPKPVEVGYRKPAAVRGLHPSGFVEVLVHSPDQLAGLDPKTHAVRIGGTVGLRKRLEIVKKARELGFYVLNPGRRVEELLKKELNKAQSGQ